MIVCLTYVNPINNQEEILNIEYPRIDYMSFKSTKEYNNDSDLIVILDSIIKDLDCTIEYDCGRPRMTTYPIYNMNLSKYYFYLSRITNQFIYNKYVDKVIKRHIDNLVFEYEHPYVPKQVNKKKRNSKKRTIPNKFIKQESINMFTGEHTYFYTNPKTGEEYESSNPDFLEELKRRKKKEKAPKRGAVPISFMTFNFKKNK